jgi:hypothetical protein
VSQSVLQRGRQKSLQARPETTFWLVRSWPSHPFPHSLISSLPSLTWSAV